jgi:hypothetical protein
MNKDIEAFHTDVKNMQRNLNSYFEAPDDSRAQSIKNSLTELEVELHTGKTGDTIQNKLKEIERQLKPAFNDNVMNHTHFNELETWVRGYLNNYHN